MAIVVDKLSRNKKSFVAIRRFLEMESRIKKRRSGFDLSQRGRMQRI
jgi:hypothetical protein